MVERAGDLLTVALGKSFFQKAKGCKDIFSSWTEVTQEERLPLAAEHSRIAEMEHGIVYVEADHPGWLQILQTKQNRLLAALRRRFPGAGFNGICFMLSRKPPQEKPETGEKEPETPEPWTEVSYEKIKSARLRETLQQLEKSLRRRK